MLELDVQVLPGADALFVDGWLSYFDTLRSKNEIFSCVFLRGESVLRIFTVDVAYEFFHILYSFFPFDESVPNPKFWFDFPKVSMQRCAITSDRKSKSIPSCW